MICGGSPVPLDVAVPPFILELRKYLDSIAADASVICLVHYLSLS